MGDEGNKQDNKWKDPDFEVDDTALGNELVERKLKIRWMRPSQFCVGSPPRLIKHSFNPTDARQGIISDCWLISALACCCEYPSILSNIIDKDQAVEGRYIVKIYDKAKSQYLGVAVDDRIPCRQVGDSDVWKPCFAQAPGDEFWVCIIEKAYAKHCGSYSKLLFNFPALALTAITGFESIYFRCLPERNQLIGLDFGLSQIQDVTGALVLKPYPNQLYNPENFWAKLKEFDSNKNLMTISTYGKDASTENEEARISMEGGEIGGLVGGHCYTLIGVRDIKGIRLCEIRNPWGSFEWKGDWSDSSPLWHAEAYKAVKNAIQPTLDSSDGTFFMPFDDVLKNFVSFTVNLCNTGTQQIKPEHRDDKCCAVS